MACFAILHEVFYFCIYVKRLDFYYAVENKAEQLCTDPWSNRSIRSCCCCCCQNSLRMRLAEVGGRREAVVRVHGQTSDRRTCDYGKEKYAA